MKRIIYTMLLFVAVAVTFCACSTAKEATTDKYIYRDRIVHDSVINNHYERDSIIIKERGDTVYYTRYRDRWRNVVEVHNDTITDTILITEQKIVTDKKEVTRYKVLNFILFAFAVMVGTFKISEFIKRKRP